MRESRVVNNSDELWGTFPTGSTFSTPAVPGVYFKLCSERRNYGARSIEFKEIRRGKLGKVSVSAAAMEGRDWFPLTLVWESTGISFEAEECYFRGVPMRYHLQRKHAKTTNAPVLSEGAL